MTGTAFSILDMFFESVPKRLSFQSILSFRIAFLYLTLGQESHCWLYAGKILVGI